MAEDQSAHRQKLEAMAVPASFQAQRTGQHYGLVVAVLGLGVALLLGLTDHESVASIIGGSTILGLVSVFVVGRFGQAHERSDQR